MPKYNWYHKRRIKQVGTMPASNLNICGILPSYQDLIDRVPTSNEGDYYTLIRINGGVLQSTQGYIFNRGQFIAIGAEDGTV